jgi:hypothetical protein
MSTQTDSNSNCTSNLNGATVIAEASSTAAAATLPGPMGAAAIIDATLLSDPLATQELWTPTWVDALNGKQIVEAISGGENSNDDEPHVSD